MKNEPNSGRPTIGNNSAVNAEHGYDRPRPKKDANSIWLASAGVLAVLILALAFLNFQKYNLFGGGDEAEESAAGPTDEDEGTSEEPSTDSDIAPTQGTSADGFPDSTALQALVNDGENAWIVGHQEKFQYRISGAVPSEDIRSAISTSVTETYGEDPALVKNELTVDPSLPAANWAGSVPSFVKTIPFETVDGSFAINNDETLLTGVAANQEKLDTVLAAAETAGLPTVKSTIILDTRGTSTLIASARDGKLDLVGVLPEQRLIDKIVADAEALYGPGNVNNLFQIDDNVFATYPMINFGRVNVGTFEPLGDFDLRLANSELSAQVRDGVLFAPGSAELTPENQEKLSKFPGFIKRANRPVFIFGHSDNTGEPQENQELSQARADSVRNYLLSFDVNPDQITSEGRGESDPIESNDTPEGKAANRRVEIAVGSS